jgi:hypothetical protein
MLELNNEHIRKELKGKSRLEGLFTINTQHYDQL